jgi:hypothetical protein
MAPLVVAQDGPSASSAPTPPRFTLPPAMESLFPVDPSCDMKCRAQRFWGASLMGLWGKALKDGRGDVVTGFKKLRRELPGVST